MPDFKLVTYLEGQSPSAGILIDERIYPVASLIGRAPFDSSSLLSIVEHWGEAEPLLVAMSTALDKQGGFALGEKKLLAPLLHPHAIYCAAANYRDHMRAMAVKLRQPDEPDPRENEIKPFHFVVPGRSCTAGPEDPITMPSHGTNIDWEIELVAVIGRLARNVSVNAALDHVAAYMIGNDVSVRDMRYLKIPNVPQQSLFRSDFVALKGFDQSCVFGPWLVPARMIPDPQKLVLKTWVGDELMQDSTTSEMVFSTAEQISYLSERVTLLPGDVIMTGTPAGTGMESDRFLQDGETIRMYIEGIGEMSQRVIR